MKKRKKILNLLIALQLLAFASRVAIPIEPPLSIFLSLAGFISGIESIIVLVRYDKLDKIEFEKERDKFWDELFGFKDKE